MNMNKEVMVLNLKDVLPNRFQPRIVFDERAITELAESIKEHGVIQPIVVRKIADKYEIIAGERRYKASLLAGKTTIPAIVTDLNDKDSAEIALIENIQRKDLTPIEEAISYKKILDMGYLSQSDLALKLGKTQSTVANKLRLLNLSEEVQEELLKGHISERHARSLLKLTKEEQEKMVKRIISERMTVRKTDEEIDKILKPQEKIDHQKKEEPKNIVKFSLEEEEGGTEKMNNEEIMGSFNIPTTPIVEQPQEEQNMNIKDENKENMGMNEGNVNPINSMESLSPQTSEASAPFSFPQNSSITESPTITDNSVDNSVSLGESNVQSGMPVFNQMPPANNEQANESIATNTVGGEVDPTNPEPIAGGKFFNMFSEGENSDVSINEQPILNTTAPAEETPMMNQTFSPVFNTQAEEKANIISSNVDENPAAQAAAPLNNAIQGAETTNSSPIIENNNPFSQFNDVSSAQPSAFGNQNVQVAQEDPLPIENVTSSTSIEQNPAEGINMTPLQSYHLNDDQTFENSSVVELGSFGNGRMEEPVLQPLRVEENIGPKVSMKEVINTIRDCEKTIENFGYAIDSDEIDFEDSYQVTFRIMKEDI